MNLINSTHKFSHIGDYCSDLSQYYKHVAIDDVPVEIVFSVSDNHIRFIIDSCNKLYMLEYKQEACLVPDSAILLYDASTTETCIKKIFYDGNLFLVLDTNGNLYGKYRFRKMIKQLDLFGTNIVDVIITNDLYFTVDANNKLHAPENRKMWYINNYNLKPNSKFFKFGTVFCHVLIDSSASISGINVTNSNFCINNNTYIKNIKYADVCILPGRAMTSSNPIWFICFDTDGIIHYGNCCTKYHIEQKQHVKVNDDVNSVFITGKNYSDDCYKHGDVYPIFCYTTSDGIFKIDCKTKSTSLLTTDIESYIIN